MNYSRFKTYIGVLGSQDLVKQPSGSKHIHILTLIFKIDVVLIYEEILIRCLIADLSLVPKI